MLAGRTGTFLDVPPPSERSKAGPDTNNEMTLISKLQRDHGLPLGSAALAVSACIPEADREYVLWTHQAVRQ
jgi:hypothetical protein